jgi:hypothetical protein
MTTFDGAPIAPETIATFRSQMEARGLDPSATLRAHGIEPSGQQQSPGGAAPPHSEPDPTSNVSYLPPHTKHGGYSSAEAQSAYDNWLKLGLPEEQIRAALEADGFTEVDDGKSEAESDFDNSALGPAASAADYKLSWVGRPQVDPTELVRLDRDFRTAFAAAQVPPAMAQGLLDSFLDSQDSWSERDTDASRGLYKMEQRAILSRMGDAAHFIKLAAVALAHMPEEMRTALHEHGCLESAAAVRRLAQIGELIDHRGKLTARR